MDLLWIFGMSTKAYAWFVVIVSLLIAVGFGIWFDKSIDEYFESAPTDLPDEINIEIEVRKDISPGKPSASQTEPCAQPSKEAVSSSLSSRPTQKAGYVPE